jgi:signal transduction histidine kinase
MQKENLNLILSIISVSGFVLLLIVGTFMLFRIYLKRKNMLLLEKEKMSIRFEQTLLRSKLEIQEETFTYISREIHDNIGQVMSLIRINLNTISLPAEDQKLTLMDELIGKAIRDLRNLSHSLDTDLILNTGWAKAAEKLLTDLQKTGTCKTTFITEEKLPALGNEKSIILFRMIQEIINNIIKHARAKEIEFKAFLEDGRITIKIGDNGKGFDRATVAAGAGLQNLEIRAKMIDATLFIHTIPGSGTCVTISVNIITHG